jgi:hypothetical protein
MKWSSRALDDAIQDHRQAVRPRDVSLHVYAKCGSNLLLNAISKSIFAHSGPITKVRLLASVGKPFHTGNPPFY